MIYLSLLIPVPDGEHPADFTDRIGLLVASADGVGAISLDITNDVPDNHRHDHWVARESWAVSP